jgi:hypothetical protein
MHALLPSGCAPEVKIAPLQSRDPWTPLMGIVAIALAFLLGWMLGQVTVLGTTRWGLPAQTDRRLPVTTGRVRFLSNPKPGKLTRRADAIAKP